MGRKRLGRGLDALLSERVVSDLRDADEPVAIDELPVDAIVRGRYQPRRDISDDSLSELAESIKAQGVMQPIIVRSRVQGGYELIAGERRWRAAKLAGLGRIPAIVRKVSDTQASAMALIENIQREDLNPLDQAHALQRLKDEFELTQQQMADAIGKSRVAVTNLLRLLNLTPAVQEMLASGVIEMGHARALLPLDSIVQERTAQQVSIKQLSVRQTEALVRRIQQGRSTVTATVVKDADTRRLERELTDRIGAPVKITCSAKGSGQLVIRYSSLDELDGIIKHLGD